MCGIAGILNPDDQPVPAATLADMVRSLRHRGPDELAMYLGPRIGLGHARLSIIDLSSGQQPMCNEDGSLWITFNGEIFNYVELRADLLAHGHRFATRSDTEVILHAYEEYGADCVHRLNGQWAFAIWSERDRTLFLSRDRMGVRPLFYTTTRTRRFAFASEIKALFQLPNVSRELDLSALDQVFTFWTTLAPKTMFAGIFELPPGHNLLVREGRVASTAYWQLSYERDGGWAEKYYADRLLELLVDATRLRMRADVPVGAYLSGGLDSTVTAALVKRFTNAPLRTFSVTFEDAEFDESRYQREAVQYVGTDHEAFHCSGADIARAFPDVVWHAEKPVVRTAPAPLFLLSSLVADRGYKVVVTGEGADEVLGGYDIFKEAKIRRFWSRFPDSTRRPRLLRRLYPYMEGIQSQPTAYLQGFFRIDAADCASPFFSHLPRWTLTSRLKLLYSADTRRRLAASHPIDELAGVLPARYGRWDYFSRAQYLEAAHLLPGYILSSQGDRMAMAHAVEGRFPFLDHRVVEFAGSLPPSLKMRALNEKYLLKRAAGGLIPPSTIARKKQPYRAPDAKSFFLEGGGAAAPYVDELLAPRHVADDGVFDPVAVARVVARVRAGATRSMRDNMAFVGILSTELLIHRFIRDFTHADDSGRGTRVHHRHVPLRPEGRVACER